MKTKYLFPYRLKSFGWIILIPSLILGLHYLMTDYEPGFLDFRVLAFFDNPLFEDGEFMSLIDNNFYNEILGALIILGALFVGFSKEKVEDELISTIRLESLVWATYINYGILLLSLIFVYDLSFFYVLVLNMFTILLLFILNFKWKIWRLRKSEET